MSETAPPVRPLKAASENIAPILPEIFCQFVRPLWRADWWPPSANNPTAYSFLPQLSGIGTDGVSLSLSLSLLKGADSSELTAMVEQDSNRPSGPVTWPRPAPLIGRPWRGTGWCVWARVAWWCVSQLCMSGLTLAGGWWLPLQRKYEASSW